MADDQMSDYQNRNLTPIIDDGFVHVDGESHVLNYDTDILKLDGEREVTNLTEYDDGGDRNPSAHRRTPKKSTETEEADVELSPGGILDEETIARGLSNLGRSANGTGQVYLNVTVPGFSLIDISALGNYIHLQRVEIPYNELTDLSPLSNLLYLLLLDASHNKISKLLDFRPPKNLKEVDLSFNMITEMSDLSAHHYLSKLNLDNNQIREINGLQNCQRLTALSLAHNKVTKIQGLDNLPIQFLNLCHNEIKKIQNLETLKKLKVINLSGNKIRSLKGLQGHDLLESVDLEDNEVIDISEIKYIRDLSMLWQLNLLRNPIQELPDYRLNVLFRIQRLTSLDRHKVEVEEKVAATNMFNPPAEVIAARDHIMHVVYSFLQPSRVWDSTLPSIETPYPMLVLVGPQGSGKKDLALKLVEEFNDYFGYGISHTTRRPFQEEIPGKDYHFVTLEKFEMDIKMGQFIQTYQYNGNWYGLQMESIESVAREGLACVIHMELEGVLTLKNTYFEPRYVLVMPLNEEAHEKRLRARGIYSESQLEYTLNRAEMYKQHNRDHPGFFDMMINSDDIKEAYKHLRRLVMDYLGIGMNTPPANDHGDTAFDSQGMSDQNVAPQLGPRTWSKPSIPDSVSQSFMRAKANQSPIMSGRGIVEEASLKRRQSAAKEAVAGYIPPLFEQLLISFPKTAPQTVEGQQGLGEQQGGDGQRSFSAPVNKAQRPRSADSSSDSSRSSSSLSGLTSASDAQQEESNEGSVQQEGKGIHLPTETVNPLELMSEPGEQSSRSGIHEPRPPSNPRSHSRGSNRPGSDRLKVLPPIGAS
ncbi:hypothetical protein ACJMK2_015742 [Sinanodonta woodiana]|uniref:Guanylate kinase-like domain-containing protein n=1 Tax=Sinanodonta woodiana TaxID=1069815 RepID=A0ABD3UTC3_SINWO